MTTIKLFTDIEQSKKLAEILPTESADMHYRYDNDFHELESIPTITEEDDHFILFPEDVRCWSLAALLSVLPDTINGTEGYCRLTIDKEGDAYNISYDDILSGESIILYAEYSLIDACVAMILDIKIMNLKYCDYGILYF